MIWPDSAGKHPPIALSFNLFIQEEEFLLSHCPSSSSYYPAAAHFSPLSTPWQTHTLDYFSNLPPFVAGPLLIQDWLSLSFRSGSRGSLVSSSDAIKAPAAVHSCACVCVYVGVYVFKSPPLLPFDVSLVGQLAERTYGQGWYSHSKTSPRISRQLY